MIITSYQNPTIKKIATLKDKKGRQQQKAYLVEGIKMVKEAINKGMPIKLVVGVKDLVENLPFNGEKIIVEESVLKKLSDCETCQGLFAVIQIPFAKSCIAISYNELTILYIIIYNLKIGRQAYKNTYI